MKRFFFALIVAGAAVSSAAGATPRSVRETLIRMEQRWVEALERRDAAAVGEILSEDFVDTTYRGERRTREEALAGLTSPSRAPTTQRLSELDARAYGDVGIVTGINTVIGRDPAFTARIRFTDVFVHKGRFWKAVSAQETLIEEGR